jgi:hypothetical protein
MNLFALAGIIIGVAAASAGMLWLARRNPLNARFSSQLGEHSMAFDFLGHRVRNPARIRGAPSV